jgi:hypothetical protein
MTELQVAALLECAEGLKDILNAADNGQAYDVPELQNAFAYLLSNLSASGVRLRGEA